MPGEESAVSELSCLIAAFRVCPGACNDVSYGIDRYPGTDSSA